MLKARVLILAAGQGSRMNAVKALLPLPLPSKDGGECSALEGLVHSYAAAGVDDVLVVSGFHAPAVEAAAHALHLPIVRNATPEKGMFSSIQAGLWACIAGGAGAENAANTTAGTVATSVPYSHIFIHPVDIPLVRPLAIADLLDAAVHNPDVVLVPAYRGVRGHPPLLPVMYAGEVAAFSGDGGLRAAWAHLPHMQVETADAFILDDMDRPDEYAALRRAAVRRDVLSPDEALRLLECRAVSERGQRHALAVGAVAHAFALALRKARRAAHKAGSAGSAEGCADKGSERQGGFGGQGGHGEFGEQGGRDPDLAPDFSSSTGSDLDPSSDFGLDPDLARASGLLHDICKGQAGHEAAGGLLMRQLGLAAMAALIEKHRDLSIADDAPLTERELMYLADKYCFGPNFVCVAERFRQKLEAFAADEAACAAIRARRGRAWALEARLGRELGQAPALVARQALAALQCLPDFMALGVAAGRGERP